MSGFIRMKILRKIVFALETPVAAIVLILFGCTPEVKPVDIFPEDNCSNCRMAISDRSFASEIITEQGEVLKFDDLGCFASFRKKNAELKIRASFVTDYETKQWLPYEKSVIVATGIETPMGSGKAAFSDSLKARIYEVKYPLP